MTTVRLFAAAAEAAGRQQLDLDVSTLDGLRQLLRQEGELAAVLPRCSYLVDGLAVGRNDDADLAGARTVDVLPPFAGG